MRRFIPFVLVVAIRKSEERGMCCAQRRELLRIIRDEVGEDAQLPWCWAESQQFGEGQMKDIDVEEMRVATNDKHIKSDSTLPA